MASDADRILVEALRLAPEERALIVAELLATLKPDVPSQERSEADWLREVERRAWVAVARTPALSWNEARARIQSRLSNL